MMDAPKGTVTLSQLVDMLQKTLEQHPERGDYPVFFSHTPLHRGFVVSDEHPSIRFGTVREI